MIGEILGSIGKWFLAASIWKRQVDKFNKQVADDVTLAVQKAHLGKLPKGVYCDQVIYTRKMTREQLCVPLDADTLAKMASCTVVHQHTVECTGVGADMATGLSTRGTVTLRVSVHFDGETADGQRIRVDVQKALLLGTIDRDKMSGLTLRTLKEIK